MRTTIRIAALALALATASIASARADDFQLWSPTIPDESTLSLKQVFDGYGCGGENLSPELAWKGAPEGTKSFVLTVYDPDAPTGSGWWHWVVYDIPAGADRLAVGAGTVDGKDLPVGSKQARTDFGTPGFGGACPPPGDAPHRYIFTLHALKVETLHVPEDPTPAFVGFVVHFNELGSTSFTAYYAREKKPATE